MYYMYVRSDQGVIILSGNSSPIRDAPLKVTVAIQMCNPSSYTLASWEINQSHHHKRHTLVILVHGQNRLGCSI